MPPDSSPQTKRPPFIISSTDIPEELGKYPGSDEPLGYGRALGRAAGLRHIGVHLERLPPGHRASYPHAHEREEEFVYVLEGEVLAWIDGETHPLKAGDFVAFPAGTGICHTFINDGATDALLLAGGHTTLPDDRIYYPLNPRRREELPWSEWWHDVPPRAQGPHDALPRQREEKLKE
jgi:uncharacterized cupin superfamily protein